MAPVIGLMFLLGLVPQLIIEQREPDRGEPAGALEILDDVGLDDLSLVCRRAGVERCCPKAMQALRALVRARRCGSGLCNRDCRICRRGRAGTHHHH